MGKQGWPPGHPALWQHLPALPFMYLISNVMTHMSNQYEHWGWACFGKRDGFEVLATEGALRQFAAPGQQEVLTQAIQLRLEEVRIFPQTEILAFSRLQHQGAYWQFFMLYRYSLDAYKRDGYYAAALGLRQATAAPNALLLFLWQLCSQSRERMLGRPPITNLPTFRPKPQALHTSVSPGTRQGFIPFATNSPSEQLAFVEACLAGKLPTFGRLLGAHSPQVTASVDTYSLKCFPHNPFYQAPPPPHTIAPPYTSPQPPEEQKRPRMLKKSVVDAYEQGSSGQWKKNEKPNKLPRKSWWDSLFGRSS
ncbi:MAG: hypothetical protein D6730_09685 [Bacteroidetes bacterium]|nr:MAG: hypothetical protein D6730_09685 [Bacteroidota bacterium]